MTNVESSITNLKENDLIKKKANRSSVNVYEKLKHTSIKDDKAISEEVEHSVYENYGKII